ncbi:winged helix-turn-helix transcriptional regulator (plasmid) [Paracoccus kondratievae]|uniref:AsnC family transcriptional regulator n=2 Tax=Bacteria TaxID=2 RepID=A0A9W6P1V0_9PSEU|nr:MULTISPECIES: Lrp/AsnC family transcriptional regulator [Paracoccus]QFQ89688.1 winged helix-turn-helix transcriptional regulator [Paracoccus kondratievae]GLK64657.1 AsnC family transcriptional regulator [Paracoccus kondratievae]GLL16323.1 AsnC family transcriptional regulator [Pseudonocardia halophobica]SMG22635.1 transcriptional regulator, AsnC family [Paracoccus sp. J56]
MDETAASRRLDAIDLRILRALSRDGRLSNSQLAEEVGLSPSPCWQRTRRLEAEGIIRGYTAILDQSRLGGTETVLIEVTLDRHDDRVLEEFGRAMTNLPEVQEIYLTTGEYDYLLKVTVSGTRGCEEFLRRKLYRVPGIRHARSIFTLRCLKERGWALPEAAGD